jgi:hypothetical protein
MNADQAWRAAKNVEETELRRWTKDGSLGEAFTHKIRDAGRGPAIGFFRNGREVKSASFDRFRRFYDDWCEGNRSADWFRNDGKQGSEAQVARFLLPVYELVTRRNKREPATKPVTPAKPKAKLSKRKSKSKPASSSKPPRRRSKVTSAEFNRRLQELIDFDADRPFMCAGDPLIAELFIVGLNPGTPTPFQPYWDGKVFDKAGWLEDYRGRHGNLKKTRRLLERLITQLDGVAYLETNLYPYPTSEFKQVPVERAKTDVVDFLVATIRPRVMFVMGDSTIEHVCKRAGRSSLPKDESFTAINWGVVRIDVMADNHFAVRKRHWSDETKIDRIAAKLKERCLHHRRSSRD